MSIVSYLFGCVFLRKVSISHLIQSLTGAHLEQCLRLFSRSRYNRSVTFTLSLYVVSLIRSATRPCRNRAQDERVRGFFIPLQPFVADRNAPAVRRAFASAVGAFYLGNNYCSTHLTGHVNSYESSIYGANLVCAAMQFIKGEDCV